ncbi:MAG TPA: HD-GYP domain-containing protein [Gemmataceae bacterium]|nr:HD-GYP domain-containing protein [Gemmataceae bacterium]
MLVKQEPSRNAARTFSPLEQAKALAVVLREEFGVPFAFYNAATGAELKDDALTDGSQGDDRVCRPPTMDLVSVHELATTGRTRVTALADGRYQLALLAYENREPILVATGAVEALAKNAAAARRELAMLEKWLQSVSDRLILADQLFRGRRSDEPRTPPLNQNSMAWEALLAVDKVTRRLRLDKDPVKNIQRILEAAFGFLGAGTLVWVPRDSDNAALVQGEDCLAQADYRQLASFLAKSQSPDTQTPILIDRFQEKQESARFPNIANLLALPVLDQDLLGWIIAINKKSDGGTRPAGNGSPHLNPPSGKWAPPDPSFARAEGGGFRKSDAALLTPFAALLGLHERSSAHHQALKDLLVGLTRSLTTAIDAKDSYTYGHSERVARIAVELGRDLGMEGNELGDLYLAGLLHDVGKIGIRDEVLSKPGKLTPEEQNHIRQHVTIGYAILSDLRQIRNLLPGVLYHHERYDGGGYPDGLVGETIPLLARILAVADSYDAMTTARPYRDPMPLAKVEQIIAEGAGTQWDKRVVEAFQRCRQKIHTIRQRGVGESLRQAIDGVIRTDSDRPASAAKQRVSRELS